jgi:catechol 2,3-dioxygenase-like lactoylglutathione lyase family enzyme
MSASDEMVVAHFIVSDDVERCRRFYTDVLGARTVVSGEGDDEVTYVALANSWIIVNVGGGPTTTSRPSRSRRRPTQIGRTASSTSGLPTSRPYTPSGPRGAPNS